MIFLKSPAGICDEFLYNKLTIKMLFYNISYIKTVFIECIP